MISQRGDSPVPPADQPLQAFRYRLLEGVTFQTNSSDFLLKEIRTPWLQRSPAKHGTS